MGILGTREPQLHNHDDVPSAGIGTNHTLFAKSGQSEHLESKDCGNYDRKVQGGAVAYRYIHLD